MATLSLIHPYPATGYADRITGDDHVCDVAIRGCRSIAELYTEALGKLELANRVTELRLFTRHGPDLDRVLAQVQLDRPEGFEMAHAHLPTGFVDRSIPTRAEMLLDVVHGLVSRLALARGWDPTVLEACRQHVVDNAFEYRWSSPPKSSPDRKHTAHAEFRLPPDGYGRARLVVTRRDDDTVVATSGEALAFCTSQGFARAAKSLRWSDKHEVSFVPYDFVRAVRGGLVRLSYERQAWSSTVEDYLTVRPIPAGDESLPAFRVEIQGRGAAAPELPSELRFVGGGPIQSEQITRFHHAFNHEMERFAGPAGQDWWRQSGIRLLDVQISYETDKPGVRARRSGERLRVTVDRPDASLATGDPTPAAREAALEVVDLVRRRTGLGPHPEYDD
ncbi:MAG: hypothetical protein V9G04_13900 [Nocardioides sp.]|jgi:hypothetical protein